MLPKGIAFRCDKRKSPPQAPPEAPAGGEENFAVFSGFISVFSLPTPTASHTACCSHTHVHTIIERVIVKHTPYQNHPNVPRDSRVSTRGHTSCHQGCCMQTDSGTHRSLRQTCCSLPAGLPPNRGGGSWLVHACACALHSPSPPSKSSNEHQPRVQRKRSHKRTQASGRLLWALIVRAAHRCMLH